jgi:uncharacterized RDD family membrane protein YckC
MYCPACGTEIDGFPCRVCGATSIGAAVPRLATAVYAGWWTRVGATVFDWLILLIPSLGAYIVGDAVANSGIGTLLSSAVEAAYLIILLSRPAGQTLGNRLMGTRVRDVVTGGALTRQQAVRRWLPYALYDVLQYAGGGLNTSAGTWSLSISLLALIDILYPLMNDRKQTWHDRFAGTVVVKD